MKNLNNVELSAILYYADFLSLLATNKPVTDTCKYFFIYDAPINSAFIVDNTPIYDENNEFFKKSFEEYILIRDKFGTDGVMSFVDNICSLSACGRVSGIDMLRCIHRYSTKAEKANAINQYKTYMNNLKYSHLIKDEDGKSKRTECTKYVAHYELSRKAATEPQLLCSNDDAVEA